MALTRPLVGLVLVSALVAGCNQSLFDNPDDGDGPPGGPGPDGGDGSTSDGGPGSRPDAGVPESCPAPCLNDAVAEFQYVDGASGDDWLYAEELSSPFRSTASAMRLESRADGTMAYVGSEGSASIVHCPSYPDYVHCAGVGDKILLETSPQGTSHPALVWAVPFGPRRHFRLSGAWLIPSSAPADAPVALLLVRNSQFDAAFEARLLTSSQPGAFDLELDLQFGDLVRLIAIADDASPIPVAVSFYVSEAVNPDPCQMMTLFGNAPGGSSELGNQCASETFRDEFDTGQACSEATCPPTTKETLVGIRGAGLVFVEGASVRYQGAPNDYAGDFTVQFWAYLDSEGAWTTETLLADHDCATERGLRVTRDSLGDGTSRMIFGAYYEDPANRCDTGPTSISTEVTDDQWHFIRLTRSTAAGTMSVCVDGEHRDTIEVPGDADISATEPLWLGRAVTYEPAYFRGKLAELRVSGQALPCSSP
jgi:hypothetical protein